MAARRTEYTGKIFRCSPGVTALEVGKLENSNKVVIAVSKPDSFSVKC